MNSRWEHEGGTGGVGGSERELYILCQNILDVFQISANSSIAIVWSDHVHMYMHHFDFAHTYLTGFNLQ